MSDRDTKLTRRNALIAASVGIAGCGTTAEIDPPAEAPPGAAPPAAAPPAAVAPPGDAPPPAEEPPLSARELLAGIDHIVVLMMENRSFDHFLGALALDAGYAGKATVEGLAGTETNPAPDGSPVQVFKMSNFTPEDPPHGWEACHAQYNAGQNDGFVKAHVGASQDEVMGYHDRSQIPLYYWFADNFAICDSWFASVLGPTWPNRFYLHATTSKGKTSNSPFLTGAPDTIWDRLKDKKLTFKNYAAGATTWYVGGFVGKLLSLNPSAGIGEFFTAAKNGTLPSFSIIDPDYMASDDHPSHNIQRGQAFVASVYKALADGPAWNKTLFIITYDEHGGFFDHVAPPVAVDDLADFQRQGFRVPAFVIGPTVKKGYVCKTQLEHSSVAATLKTRFDIKSLSKRMDAASDVSDCIDPAKVRSKSPSPPPPGMPKVVMTMETALYDGVGQHSQPVLEKMVADGVAPKVDHRSDQERIAAWLEHAERLGAVRIVHP
ncbi:MAG: alkaline phosphatase family protein [Labilithrix sp.]|nr:alkaline phosphatase family protein [Labilithrix sp.]